MNDRALIEAAAAAAGLTIDAAKQAERDAAIGADKAGLWLRDGTTWWHPLDDDGQALRLAVRLNLHVWVSNPLTYAGLDGNLRIAEGHIEHGCAAKATRRAIVKAAARMAK